ncbi:light-regulated protein, chloroplastic-like [Mangifera indica]|uniref:light-regulated protein, chloroplastic-like n=1 Tax=Mangifera indica TaxID=29780 RepID=UPI001CFB9F54|nr:light-regulated protein, chloroplastic-like [Mangifera indica]
MQASLSFSPSFLSIVTPSKTLALPGRVMPRQQTSLCPSIKATPVSDSSTVDYSSMTSVFPAEACETIGGDACDAEMYPEVKLKPEIPSSKAETSSESIDRDYLDYSSPKTVFPGEACDDLGGEFCEPKYQEGVY